MSAANFQLAPTFLWVNQNIDNAVIIEPPVQMYRWSGSGPRRYFCEWDKELHWFLSVTTTIDAVSPTSSYLIEWIARHGVERARQIAKESADYGTLMHIVISAFLRSREMDISLPAMEAAVAFHVKQEGILYDVSSWPEQLRRDMLSFAQFCADVRLEPVAIECVLPWLKESIGGAIDCVAWVDIKEKGFWGEIYKSGPNKGQPKETFRVRRALVMIDWKSCRKGFYVEHEIQLEIYKRIWHSWFLETLPIEFLCNWRPTEWSKEPSYHLKDQTGRHSENEIAHIIGLAKERLSLVPPAVYQYPEKIVLQTIPESVTQIAAQDVAKSVFAEVLPAAGGESNGKEKKKRKSHRSVSDGSKSKRKARRKRNAGE